MPMWETTARATHPASISRPTPTPGRAVSLPIIVSLQALRSTRASTNRIGVPTPIKPPNITVAPSGIKRAASAAEIAPRMLTSRNDVQAGVDVNGVTGHTRSCATYEEGNNSADFRNVHQPAGWRSAHGILDQFVELR